MKTAQLSINIVSTCVLLLKRNNSAPIVSFNCVDLASLRDAVCTPGCVYTPIFPGVGLTCDGHNPRYNYFNLEVGQGDGVVTHSYAVGIVL